MAIAVIAAAILVIAGIAIYSGNLSPTGKANGIVPTPLPGIEPTPCREGDANCGDTIPPQLVITYPLNGQTIFGTINVTADANDNDGVNSVKFFINGVLRLADTTAPYSYSWNTTDVIDGNATIKAVATDLSGNKTTKTKGVFVSNNTDINAPFVNITSPTSNPTYTTTSSTINLAGATGDNVGVVSMTWGINTDGNGVPTLTQSNTYWTANNLPLTVGLNVITIRARDAAGNIGQDMITVTRDANQTDTNAPTVVITSPANGQTLTTATWINVTANDNIGVTKVDFRIDGVFKNVDFTAPYQYLWDINAIPDGNHSINARAYDAANNQTNATISVITNDNNSAGDGNVALSITITSPTSNPNYDTNGPTIALGGTSTGAAQITWTINTDGNGIASGTNNWNAFNLPLQFGANIITMTARNAIGQTVIDTITINDINSS